jgi:hypothetical protein
MSRPDELFSIADVGPIYPHSKVIRKLFGPRGVKQLGVLHKGELIFFLFFNGSADLPVRSSVEFIIRRVHIVVKSIYGLHVRLSLCFLTAPCHTHAYEY